MWHLTSKYRFALTLFLAIILAIPLFYLFSESVHQKYVFVLDSTEPVTDHTIIQYSDLDNDGWSERIFSGHNPLPTVFLTVGSKSGVVNQWNFPGTYPTRDERLFISDYDNNGFSELYLFVLQFDSLWLYMFEPLNPESPEERRVFVDRITPKEGSYDFGILEGGFYDTNENGYNELIFGIWTTFSASPRKVLIYDIKNNTLRSSESFGASIRSVIPHYFNNETKPSIIIENHSHGNTQRETHQYHDHSCWIMVFDHNLEFRFDPVEVPGIFSYFNLAPFKLNGVSYIAASQSIIEKATDNSFLYLINSSGDIVATRKLPDALGTDLNQVHLLEYKGEQAPFLLSHKGELFLLDKSLNQIKKSADGLSRDKPVIIDIEGDGSHEIIFARKDRTGLRIFLEDFRQSSDIVLPTSFISPAVFSVIKHPGQPSQLSISLKDLWLSFNFTSNPVYPFRYLFYALILFISLGFIMLIQLLTRRQMLRRIAIERQLSTLQINNILTQLDPHFTFNSLHSIGSYILREKKEEAYDYLVKFSQVIRSGLSDADKVCRSLKNEIAILVNYLELQRQAYPEKFEYEINIAENVDQNWMVPKMILHTHVENALKHGIFTRPGKGTVKLEVSAGKRSFTIVIGDNGIGREEAAKINGQTTRKGLDLFNRFIEYFNNSNAEKIQQVITDLYNPDGTPAGTRVSISIPIHYNYSLTGR